MAQQTGGLEDHHHDQKQGVDHHAVAVEGLHDQRQRRQYRGRADGAGHGAHAAQHHHEQHVDGGHEVI